MYLQAPILVLKRQPKKEINHDSLWDEDSTDLHDIELNLISSRTSICMK